MFYHVENQEFFSSAAAARAAFPATSFPQSIAALRDALRNKGVYPVVTVPYSEDFNTLTHKKAVGSIEVIEVDGVIEVRQVEILVALTEEEITTAQARTAEDARLLRTRRLKDSDWTQNRDVQLANDAEWQAYRQALRDITKQAGFPENIVWPTPP